MRNSMNGIVEIGTLVSRRSRRPCWFVCPSARSYQVDGKIIQKPENCELAFAVEVSTWKTLAQLASSRLLGLAV